MKILTFVGLCLVLLSTGIGAEQSQLRAEHPSARELAVEYRIRIQAQDFLVDVALFDDMGTLGRGIRVIEPKTSEDNTSGVAEETGLLPDTAFGQPAQISSVSAIALEMDHSNLNPIVDLRLEIEGIQEAMLQRQKMKLDQVPEKNKSKYPQR